MDQFIATTELAAADVAGRTREIYDTMLRESRYVDSANFTLIHPKDVERLFDLYDMAFFQGQCRRELGQRPFRFRLSKRMTSAGGTTSRFGLPDPNRVTVYGERFEIAVATSLLFQTFREDHRPVKMSGIECRDRLEALQRVLEHEMVHLIADRMPQPLRPEAWRQRHGRLRCVSWSDVKEGLLIHRSYSDFLGHPGQTHSTTNRRKVIPTFRKIHNL